MQNTFQRRGNVTIKWVIKKLHQNSNWVGLISEKAIFLNNYHLEIMLRNTSFVFKSTCQASEFSWQKWCFHWEFWRVQSLNYWIGGLSWPNSQVAFWNKWLKYGSWFSAYLDWIWFVFNSCYFQFLFRKVYTNAFCSQCINYLFLSS